MAYEQPGVKVIQQLAASPANIQDAPQVATIVGPLFEVFDARAHATPYDAVTGAGAQTFSWPGKKTTSIVDLQGIRKSISEPDSQLLAGAEFPLKVQLRDPETSQVFDVNLLTDVYAVTQSGFSIVQGSGAATARASGANATAAQAGRFHRRAGGLVNAGIAVGDRIRLTNAPDTPTFDVIGTVSAFGDDDVTFVADGMNGTVKTATLAAATTIVMTVTGTVRPLPSTGKLLVGSGTSLELVSYSAVVTAGQDHTFTVTAMVFAHAAGVPVSVQIVDDADVTGNDGSLVTPGSLISAGSNFTGKTGTRLAIWVEQTQVNDGVSTGAKLIDTGSLAIDSTYVGRKATIWTQQATASDGDLNAVSGQLSSAGAAFVSGDVGKIIKIGTAYRRVTAVISGTVLAYDGAALTGTGVTYVLYTPNVRTIVAVDPNGQDFTVDSNVAAGTALPVVIHRAVHRDVSSVTSATQVVYSGGAISSDTGYLRFVPFDLFDEAVTFEIFPSYELLVTYRALDIVDVNKLLTAYTASGLSALGTVHKANPLLWAAQAALVAMGTDDQPLQLMPVDLWADDTVKTGFPEDRDEASGYLKALDILAADPLPYYLVPLTRNTTVRDAFVTHVNAQSAPTEKQERGCYLTYALPLGAFESTTGTIAPGLNAGNKVISDPGKGFVTTYGLTPGKKVVIKNGPFAGSGYEVAAGSDDDNLVLAGSNWAMTGEFSVSNADTTVAGEVTTVTPNAWKDVEPGDYLLLGSVTKLITAVQSGPGGVYTKLLYAGAALVSGTGQTVSVLRTSVGVEYYVDPLTKDQQATALAGISQARGNRRVIHVWPDVIEQVTGTDAQGNDVKEFVPSWFLAAAEAGRDSVMEPERSSTGMALAGFTALDHSNRYFNTTQLNTIANGGWTIFEQKQVDGPIVCRHLLTTDRSTVKTQEFSFTKNVDNMAKVKRASLEPLLNDDKGRINITKQFLTALVVPIQGIYETFVKEEQLVRTETAEPYKILSIRQDPTALDNILEEAELNVPLPANRVTVTFII